MNGFGGEGDSILVREQRRTNELLTKNYDILYKIFIVLIIVAVLAAIIALGLAVLAVLAAFNYHNVNSIMSGMGSISSLLYELIEEYQLRDQMRSILPSDNKVLQEHLEGLYQGIRDAANVVTQTRDLGVMSVLYGVGRVIMDISDSPLAAPGANGIASIFDWTKTKIDSGQVDRGFSAASTTLEAISVAVNTTHFQSATASVERILANPLVENVATFVANISTSTRTREVVDRVYDGFMYGTEGERMGKLIDRGGEMGSHITDIAGQISEAHVLETLVPRAITVAENAAQSAHALQTEVQTYIDYRQKHLRESIPE